MKMKFKNQQKRETLGTIDLYHLTEDVYIVYLVFHAFKMGICTYVIKLEKSILFDVCIS